MRYPPEPINRQGFKRTQDFTMNRIAAFRRSTASTLAVAILSCISASCDSGGDKNQSRPPEPPRTTEQTGRVVIDPQFDGAEAFSEGLAAVRVGGNPITGAWGFIDTQGRF